MIVPKSKTDIYRRGNKVLIAKTGNKLCPVTFLRRYINFPKNRMNIYSPLFSFVNASTSTNCFTDLNRYLIPELGKSF